MTTKVQAAMMLGNGVIHYEIGVVASGSDLYFYPLLASPRALEITEIKTLCSDDGNSAEFSLEVGTIGSSFTAVNLTGGNTPVLLTTLDTHSPSDTFSDSATQYVAAGDAIRIRVDNSGAGSDDAENIIVEIYATVTDV
jgi:hypothetical protein